MTVWCIWLYMIVQHISIFICFKERKKSRTAKHASDHDTYIITPEQYNRNTYNTLSYVWSSQHQVQRFQFISAHSHVITQKNMYWSSGTILSCASFNAPRLKDSKMCNGISGSTFESIIGVRGGGGGGWTKAPRTKPPVTKAYWTGVTSYMKWDAFFLNNLHTKFWLPF